MINKLDKLECIKLLLVQKNHLEQCKYVDQTREFSLLSFFSGQIAYVILF